MDGSSYGVEWFLRLAGDVAFRYVPATIGTLTGNTPDLGLPNPVTTPITQAVTPEQVMNYLSASAVPGGMDAFYQAWGTFVLISTFLSLLLGALVIYCIVRIRQIRRFEEARFRAAAHPVASQDISKAQLRWNRIKEEVASGSEQNWRLAILEADIMLNDLLDVRGYRGETMADKMKQVERADWKTIDFAWEAHKVRNAIAHQGTMQALDEREARRVIGLYERVFKEFQYIQ